jgi:flagellar basal-body rod protein FlgF
LDSGYYAACQGMRSQSQALELIANNLANVNTTGYLGGQPTFHSLLAASRGVIANPLNRVMNDFNTLSDTRFDLHSGNLERTGNSFDLAIEGEGFFTVQTKAGTFYTRNGSFQVSPTGELVTAAGDTVLGEQGPVTVPAGQVSISPDGTISVNGAAAGKLRVVEFASGTTLEAAGNSLYSGPADKTAPAVSSSVRQGMLAASNVNPISAVVDLLSVQRNHDMLQRALSTFYSDFNRIAADDLPRV